MRLNIDVILSSNRGKAFLHCNAIYGLVITMAEATVEELAGFITGNVKRKQILDVLDKNESATYETIRKLTRMPKLILDKALKDMSEKGAVTKLNEKYTLTEIGKKVASSLPRQSNKAGSSRYEANIHREI